jgi:hypothetical protein
MLMFLFFCYLCCLLFKIELFLILFFVPFCVFCG